MKFIADEQSEGQRIDIYLAGIMHDFSRSKIQSLLKDGSILLNGKKIKPSYSLNENDVITISYPEQNNLILPENIPLEIIWEDENMAVINKPSGMLNIRLYKSFPVHSSMRFCISMVTTFLM